MCTDLIQTNSFTMPWLDKKTRINPLDIISDTVENNEIINCNSVIQDLNNDELTEHLCTPLSSYIGEENFEEVKIKKNSKVKYTCLGCEINCWAKNGIKLICGTCNIELIENIKINKIN